MIYRAGHTFLIIIITILTGVDSKAQSPNPDYHFKHLNVQNGLSQNIVYHFLQDSYGYMWIGTHNGLTLFDGISTTNFLHNDEDKTSIAGAFITSILEDSLKQIWIGNESGIDLYNRVENCFSHFGVDRPDGTNENTYCVLLGFISANELWFLDTKTRSIRSLNTKTKSSSFIAELNASHAVLYKGSGQTVHIWSAYDKGTIHQVYRNSELISQRIHFSGKEGSIKNPQLEVIHILQQNNTTVWLSTNKGLVKLNPVLNEYSIFNQSQKQVVSEVRYAALSPKKEQVWIGTGSAGIYTFDINTNQFIENYRNSRLDQFSICSDNIVCLYFDHTGNIWCGSYGKGISYARTENIFFKNHLSKNEMQPWNGDNHILWAGADNHENIWCMMSAEPGIWVLDKELTIRKYIKLLLDNGTYFAGNMYKLLFDKDDNVWCTSNKGLYRYNPSTNQLTPVKYPLVNDEVQGSIWIKDIIQLNDHSIIFSTFWGLYRITGGAANPVVKPITFLNPGSYSGFGPLFQDKAGFVYVKSLGDSIYILKSTGGGKYDLYKSLFFMPEINHYYSEEGDSNIYISSSNGLYRLTTTTFEVTKEELSNKLPFFNVSSVFKKDNKLWVFGEKGLYFFDEKNKQGRRYTVEDGLPTNEFTLAALVYTSDRRCIAGTSNGLISFFPDRKQDSIYPPRPRIMNIYINDVLYTSTRNPNETKKINLSYRQNTFSFDFAPIAFTHAAESGFEFKLEGYDESWIKSDVANYIRYSKIPPGNYVFSLRATDATGRVSPFTKTVEIEIARAFWQTTLFKIAGMALILLTGWLLSRWYFSYKIRKQKLVFEKQQVIERERTRIATDMHDDLGAGLSRIKFISQSISNKKIEDESIKTELEKITGYSDEMTEKMGEIVWALNEKNDTLADLVAYSRSYAIEYLANHDIACTANTPLGLPGTFIAGEMRRNIFLSVKECLHNIVKHAGATCVSFSVELGHMIRITIHDNGKGIDWNNKRAFSNGIQNIRQRMKDVKGEVEFYNENGTKVVLIIPL